MNKITTIVIVSLTLVMLLFTLAGHHGLLHLQHLNREVRLLREKNEALTSEGVAVKNEIYAVSHSSEELEKKAREELGLAKPNEIVYIFPEIRRGVTGDDRRSNNAPSGGDLRSKSRGDNE